MSGRRPLIHQEGREVGTGEVFQHARLGDGRPAYRYSSTWHTTQTSWRDQQIRGGSKWLIFNCLIKRTPVEVGHLCSGSPEWTDAMRTPFTDASTIPVNEARPVITYSPVTLNVAGRLVDLEMKVSAPATGDNLPIVLLSHGHGVANFLSSLRGYGPLADFWAAHGFVVIQPTHLDSTALGLRECGDPEAPMFLRSRATDMSLILDHLDQIEASVPGLAGRLDRDRVAVAGHSLGGTTSSMLLGARVLDPNDHHDKDLSDSRIKAGVVISACGVGNDGHLAAWAAENYPALKYLDFSTMTTPALVVAGDQDINFNFSNRLGYRADAYPHSPAPKSLLMVFGAQHMLGGISGYDALETSTEDHEDPERVAAVRALCWAYLWSQLYPDSKVWAAAIAALNSSPDPVGRVESK